MSRHVSIAFRRLISNSFSFLFFFVYINHSNCLRKRKEGEEKSRCNIVNVPSLESKFKKKLNDLEFFLYLILFIEDEE